MRRCRTNRRTVIPVVACAVIVAGLGFSPARAASAEMSASTPQELVSTYADLADTILGAKKTEKNLIRSILAMTYRHAEATRMRVKGMISSGKDCKAEVELLAGLVSQLGNEGDAQVAAIRKRLVEGGHHHNAAGEQQGLYDEGFVVVTRAAKKVFLDAAGRIGKMAASPDAAALDAAWLTVEKQYKELEGAGH